MSLLLSQKMDDSSSILVLSVCKNQKKQQPDFVGLLFFGDPDENRTRVTAVKGRCLNRLTTGPYARQLLAAIW